MRQHPGAIVISPKAIGTSIRSTPATHTGVMDEIRKAFAAANGVAPSLFSFNSKGACEACGGTGRIVYDMAFAEPVEVVCEQCGGHRYSKTALGYAYKGRNIDDALNLTVNEALEFPIVIFPALFSCLAILFWCSRKHRLSQTYR